MENNEGKGWGLTTAVWVVVAAVILALLVYIWNKNCTEKAEIAAGVQKLVGRVDALEPAVTAQGNNIYTLNGVMASTVQGVKDLKQCFGDDIYQLNEEIFYGRSHSHGRSGCGGCGNREFRQTSTYNLASTNVTVDETCRN
jgi:outer membrane murein-binding lipoprotein Lpp